MKKARIYYTRDRHEERYALFCLKPHETDGAYYTNGASLLCVTQLAPFDDRLPKLRAGQVIIFEQVTK
jgi:hypothetical protein